MVVLSVLAFLVGVRWRDAQPYSGDEPHYVLVTGSLIHDGDVDIKNDYLDRRYRAYYPGHFDPTPQPGESVLLEGARFRLLRAPAARLRALLDRRALAVSPRRAAGGDVRAGA